MYSYSCHLIEAQLRHFIHLGEMIIRLQISGDYDKDIDFNVTDEINCRLGRDLDIYSAMFGKDELFNDLKKTCRKAEFIYASIV